MVALGGMALVTACGGGRASIPDQLDDRRPDPGSGGEGSGGDGSGGFVASGGVGGSGGFVASSGGGSGGFFEVGGTGGTAGGSGGRTGCIAPIDLSDMLLPLRVAGEPQTQTSLVSACSGSGRETYYLWTCPDDSTYLIDTFGSGFDTVLSYGRGVSCHFDYDAFECNDDSGDLTSALNLPCAEGQVVTIVVDAFSPSTSDHVLNISRAEDVDICPVADLGSAIASPAATGTIPEGNFGSSGRYGDCNGGPPRRGFAWTAPHSGRFRIDTFGSNYDTILTLRDECYGDVYICDDDSGGGLQSAVIVNLMEGSQVVIEIAAFGGDAQGSGMGHADYVLNITDVD